MQKWHNIRRLRSLECPIVETAFHGCTNKHIEKIWKGWQERIWITSWTLQVSSISMENSGWMESLSLVFTMCSSWISVVGKKSSANGSRKSSGFSPDRKTSSRAATTRLGSKDCHYVTSVPRGSWSGHVAETFWRILQPETSIQFHPLTLLQ